MKGYTFTLGSTGSSARNFGFQSFSTISGQVYRDANESGIYDSGEAQAWTVNLYQGTNTDARRDDDVEHRRERPLHAEGARS